MICHVTHALYSSPPPSLNTPCYLFKLYAVTMQIVICNCVSSKPHRNWFVIARANVSCGYLSMLYLYLAIYFSNVIRFISISNYVCIFHKYIYHYYVLLPKLSNNIISFFFICVCNCFVSRILSNKFVERQLNSRRKKRNVNT